MPANDPERDGAAPPASLFPLRFDDGSTIDVAHIAGGAWPPRSLTLLRTAADGTASFARFSLVSESTAVQGDRDEHGRAIGPGGSSTFCAPPPASN